MTRTLLLAGLLLVLTPVAPVATSEEPPPATEAPPRPQAVKPPAPEAIDVAIRRGDAEFLQIIETADPGAVAPDPGIVEDRGSGVKLGREIGGVDPAMRGVDDDRASGFRADAGDAVGDDDRRGHRQDSAYAAAAGRAASTSRTPAMMRLRSGKTWFSRIGL